MIIHEGGKIIGQGKAGCIMSPSMICSGETERRDGLSKLTTIMYSHHEERVHRFIDPIDPHGYFHIPIEHICIPRAPVKSNNLIDDIKNCEVLRRAVIKKHKTIQKIPVDITDENANTYRLIIMKNGGSDLLDIGKTILNFPQLRNKLGGTDFIMMFTYSLFVGITKLAANNIVHSDIFLTNILYNTANNRFSLIDFGFAFSINNPDLPVYNTRKNAIDARIPFETLVCENPKLFSQYTSDRMLPVDALFDIYYYKFDNVIYRKSLAHYRNYNNRTAMELALRNAFTDPQIIDLDQSQFREYVYRKYDVFSLGLTLAIFMRIISGTIYHGRDAK
jgi:hypothetical protein